MSNLITQSGTIIYDPERGTMKSNTNYWCIVQLPDDLVRYYQYFMRSEKHVHLCMPAWGAHVSVVRGEKPREEYLHLWKKYHKKKVQFQYNPIIKTHKDSSGGSFYFIDFVCDELMDIRAELGLSIHKHLHFTVGRTYYD